MKKYIILVAIATFSAFACSKIDSGSEGPNSLTYNFTIADKPSFGTSTRSVKTSWEEGDKIYIVFDNALPEATTDFLILKYDGETWVVDQIPATPPTGVSGSLDALYYPTTDMSISRDGDHIYITPHTNSQAGQWLHLVANDASYKIDGQVLVCENLTLDIDRTNAYNFYAQLCVTGLTGEWRARISSKSKDDESTTYRPFYVPRVEYGYVNASWVWSWSGVDFESYQKLNALDDGHYLWFTYGRNATGDNRSLLITLYNNSKRVTFEKEFDRQITNGENFAIRFAGPQGTLEELVAMGSGETTSNGWTKK